MLKEIIIKNIMLAVEPAKERVHTVDTAPTAVHYRLGRAPFPKVQLASGTTTSIDGTKFASDTLGDKYGKTPAEPKTMEEAANMIQTGEYPIPVFCKLFGYFLKANILTFLSELFNRKLYSKIARDVTYFFELFSDTEVDQLSELISESLCQNEQGIDAFIDNFESFPTISLRAHMALVRKKIANIFRPALSSGQITHYHQHMREYTRGGTSTGKIKKEDAPLPKPTEKQLIAELDAIA